MCCGNPWCPSRGCVGGWLRGSAPPPAHPIPREFSFRSQALLHSPGPPMFAEHPGLCSPAGVGAGSREEFPWQGSSPEVGSWLRHPGLGYPACCLSQHGAAACPGLRIAPGSPALPIPPFQQRVPMGDGDDAPPSSLGDVGVTQTSSLHCQGPLCETGGAGLGSAPFPLWSGSFDLGRGHRGAGPR